MAAQLGSTPTLDTGDLRADLIAGITTLTTALSGTTLGSVLPALVADLACDPELAAEFHDRVFAPRRASTARAIDAARLRGDIRQTFDLDFVLDALAAPTYYRVLFRHLPVDARLAAQSVDAVLVTLAVDDRWKHPYSSACYHASHVGDHANSCRNDCVSRAVRRFRRGCAGGPDRRAAAGGPYRRAAAFVS